MKVSCFEGILKKCDERWNEEVVSNYLKLKLELDNSPYLSAEDFKLMINELFTHYRNFINSSVHAFAPYILNDVEEAQLEKYLEKVHLNFKKDTDEFERTYKEMIFRRRQDFLPMPTVHEQHLHWKIFPDDPGGYPQYYTSDLDTLTP